jgi:hypothetical protein
VAAVAVAVFAVAVALRVLLIWRFTPGWIVPDETVYTQLARSVYSSFSLDLLHENAGFYTVLYPALLGVALRGRDLHVDPERLRVIQALVLCGTALPTFLWARTLMARRWALVAAGGVLLLPSMSYAGFAMTEVLFVPVFVLATWSIAAAVARPTLLRQGLMLLAITAAALTRLQGLVLLPILVTALLMLIVGERSARRLLPFAPTALAAVVVTAVALWQRATETQEQSSALGAYSSAQWLSAPLQSIWWSLNHATSIAIAVGFLPMLALGVLAIEELRGVNRPSEERAFTAVATSSVVWLALQAGFFVGSNDVGRVLGRYVIGAEPAMLIALALWLSRGRPRRTTDILAVAIGVVVAAAVFPLDELMRRFASWDEFNLVAYNVVTRHTSTLAAHALLVALVVLFGLAALRQRLPAALLVAAVFVLLAVSSILVTPSVNTDTREARASTVGASLAWLETGEQPAAFFYSSEIGSDATWRTLFWHPNITSVVDITRDLVPGPLPQHAAGLDVGGTVTGVDDLPNYVITSDTVLLTGARISESPRSRMALWYVSPPVRVTQWVEGLNEQRYASSDATLHGYDCSSGRIRIDVVGKDNAPIVLFSPNGDIARFRLHTGRHLTRTVRVPRALRKPPCAYTLRSPAIFRVFSFRLG